MKIMTWINEKLHNSVPDKFQEAMRAVDDFAVRARSLREQIQPYAREEDPFEAILTARESAQSYMENQDSRAIKEPD